MTKEVSEKKPKISIETRELADNIKKGIIVDTQKGTFTSEDGLYYKLLPEGLTEEVVKQAHNYDNKFISASVLGIGELALEAFTANSDINKFTGSISTIDKDHIDITTTRSRTINNELTKGVDVTTYGVTRATVHREATQDKGETGHILDEIKEAFKAKFAE